MKWLIKWIFRLVLLVVILGGLFVLFKDSVWTMLAERRIRARTGMEVQIGKFSSGLFSQTVTIHNLKLYNTPEFGGTLFLEIPELHLELDPLALPQRQLRFKLVRLDLSEIDIVRNELGRTNIFTLLEKEKPHGAAKEKNRFEKLLGDLKFESIDVLNLSLGKIKFIDLKNSVNNREVPIGMQNQVFRNVQSEGDAYAILFMIWLRSGGKLSIAPDNLAKDYFDRKVNRIETTVRQALDKPAK